MKARFFRRYSCAYVIYLTLTMLFFKPDSSYSSTAVNLTSPANGATVSGNVTVAAAISSGVVWVDFYIDGIYLTCSPPYIIDWNSQNVKNGTHTISVTAFAANHAVLGSSSVTVYVSNNSNSSSSSSSSWQVTPGATISGLTGSGSTIPGADTNPADYGHYWASGGSADGYSLIGGPLLSDWQAASFVKKTQKSNIELNSAGTGYANAVANNYFNYIASTNPSNYLYQLQAFHSAYNYGWGASWKAEVYRVDGACPIANPTTAEVLQWAANKWGINPLLLYADATIESHWDQTGVGDYGGSAGLFQIADRDTSVSPNHAYPGFSGGGSMLARESSCFNADFYAAFIYSAFHGLIGGGAGQNNILGSVQLWDPGVSIYVPAFNSALLNQSWETRAFGGAFVPY